MYRPVFWWAPFSLLVPLEVDRVLPLYGVVCSAIHAGSRHAIHQLFLGAVQGDLLGIISIEEPRWATPRHTRHTRGTIRPTTEKKRTSR